MERTGTGAKKEANTRNTRPLLHCFHTFFRRVCATNLSAFSVVWQFSYRLSLSNAIPLKDEVLGHSDK
jgi:hypothetical protein